MSPERNSHSVLHVLRVGSVLVPLLALALWAHQAWDYRREQAIETARKNAEIVREYVLRIVQTQEAMLGQVDESVRGLGWSEIADSEGVQTDLRRLNEGGLTTGLALVDPSGMLRVSDRARNLRVDTTDRDYFTLLRDKDGPIAIGGRITGRLSGQDTFVIARRRSGAGFDGVLATSVRVDTLVKFFQQLRIDDGTVVALVRKDGNLLARSPALSPRTYPPESHMMRAFAESESGLFEARGITQGIERIHAFARVGDLPLYVTYGLARDTIAARWRGDLTWAALFAALAAALGFTAATQALRRARADAAYRERLGAEVGARTADLQKALADKDVLLREVHHRVKNNLQMIASMVNIASRRPIADAPAALTDISRRIVTVGRAYDAVYHRDDLHGIDLGAYLRGVADQIVAGSGRSEITVRTKLDPAAVDIDTALPVGLIAHELVVNALKHAFPAGRAGEILLRLEVLGPVGVLTVRDNGAGLTAPARDDSTGLKLIEALAPQIDGHVRSKTRAGGGAQFRLTFRLVRQGAALGRAAL